MHELKSWCSLSTPNTPRRQMWNMVKQAGLGLITSEECPDVEIKDVTKQEAEKVCAFFFIYRSKINFFFILSSSGLRKKIQQPQQMLIWSSLMRRIW